MRLYYYQVRINYFLRIIYQQILLAKQNPLHLEKKKIIKVNVKRHCFF